MAEQQQPSEQDGDDSSALYSNECAAGTYDDQDRNNDRSPRISRDEVPRIISYSRLPSDENKARSKSVRASTATMVAGNLGRKPSDLTDTRSMVRFEDNLSITAADENKSLLSSGLSAPTPPPPPPSSEYTYSEDEDEENYLMNTPFNRHKMYGAAATGNGGSAPKSKTWMPGTWQSPKGVLRSPTRLGLGGLPSPPPPTLPPRAGQRGRSKTLGDVPSIENGGQNQQRQSFNESWTGTYSDGGGSIVSLNNRSETIVYAPDDVRLPPQTPLLGSSKLVVNVRSAELKRQASLVTWAGDVSAAGTVMSEAEYLEKVRNTFYEDAITFAEGSIPQSIVVATVIGIVCGLVAYLYYLVLFLLLDVVWKDLPNKIVIPYIPEHLHVLWIPIVTFTMSIFCGLSIYYLGEPGDLAFTIKCVHEKAYESTHHILPMVTASLFSILAGASLGPEAPLVSVCAATAGFISRKVFRQRNRNVVRKHTLMGMSGALAAFFGVPLGGSLFALEVTSRFGIEYFEHMIEAIFCGEVCVGVFRTLAQIPMGAIWKIEPTKMDDSEPFAIVIGAVIGLLGAGLSFCFASFHWRLMGWFRWLGVLDDENQYAIPRVLIGAAVISTLGMLVPHTMFWGEFEFEVIATMSPASELPHVWPTSGLLGFEMDTWYKCLIVGFGKILAISFTVASGYRGGFIFPFFTAGAAFGRALMFAFPKLSPSIACLCFAAGINVAITRTALASSLILAFLSGEQYALPSVLAASVVSLFATGYTPFIKSQIVRSDIDHSLFYRKNAGPKIQDTVRTVNGSVPPDVDEEEDDDDDA